MTHSLSQTTNVCIFKCQGSFHLTSSVHVLVVENNNNNKIEISVFGLFVFLIHKSRVLLLFLFFYQKKIKFLHSSWLLFDSQLFRGKIL